MEVPVLAISSVGRASYRDAATLDAFKGSGDLEYDADCCLLLKPKEDTGDGPARSSAAAVDLHVMKSRYGELTFDHPIALSFDRRYGTFRELRAAAGGAPPPPRLAPLR